MPVLTVGSWCWLDARQAGGACVLRMGCAWGAVLNFSTFPQCTILLKKKFFLPAWDPVFGSPVLVMCCGVLCCTVPVSRCAMLCCVPSRPWLRCRPCRMVTMATAGRSTAGIPVPGSTASSPMPSGASSALSTHTKTDTGQHSGHTDRQAGRQTQQAENRV